MYESNDVKDIIYTVTPVVMRTIKKLSRFVNRRIRCIFGNTHSDGIRLHQLTHHFKNNISDIFLNLKNKNTDKKIFIENFNNIIEAYGRIIHKSDLNETVNQEEIFEQMIQLLNYLCYNELSIKYLNNTLTLNNLENFSTKTIGDKVYSLHPLGEGKSGGC